MIQHAAANIAPVSSNGTRNTLGYAPQYPQTPFIDFDSVTPQTPLESLNLNWREADLPQRVRTKHVHSLHPYLGKFVPQIVEIFLRKFEPTTVCDPFCGSGTTLVEAAALGINAIGCDISEFNTLITRVKTRKYNLELLEYELYDILNKATISPQPTLMEQRAPYHPSTYLNDWFSHNALESLLSYQSLIHEYTYSDVLRLILSRAARSARRTTHFDLDFPKIPQKEPYYCYKHSRICKPTDNSAQFLKRYTSDTMKRIREYASLRKDVALSIIAGDTRTTELPKYDLVITSPPYVGLIDYHEQHRYSYELLGLGWKAEQEIGPAKKGNSQRARTDYLANMVESFKNIKKSLAKNGRMVVIVNDKLGLYEKISEQVGLRVETRLERHVNRRTGRRAGDFFESVFVWTT